MNFVPSLIANAKARKKPRVSRVQRRDPSRTTMLRRRWLRALNVRFAALRRDIRELIDTDDALGLREIAPLPERLATNARQWQFLRSDQKVAAFKEWLQQQINARVLSLDATGSAWTDQYVRSAYKKGLLNAFAVTRRGQLGVSPDFYAGTQAEFLHSSFGGSVAFEKVQLLATRAFESLRGVSSQMSVQMSRILAGAIADGKNPYQVVQKLHEEVGLSLARAARVARTEIMHAHAEGQLDSYEKLGVKELGVLAEWSTAGDDLVCPLCRPLEGGIFTVAEARGLIPRHPNCRCSWIPANVSEKEAGQIRTARGLRSAVVASVKREKRSRWAGATRKLSGKRSQKKPSR